MKRLKFFLPILFFALSFTSCIQEESMEANILDDNAILKGLFQPELLSNKGYVKGEVLYIEFEAAELDSEIAAVLRNKEQIQMGEAMLFNKADIANIIGTDATGTFAENGLSVPVGPFELMVTGNTVDASAVDTRSNCLHWCRCWPTAGGGELCIDIEICY